MTEGDISAGDESTFLTALSGLGAKIYDGSHMQEVQELFMVTSLLNRVLNLPGALGHLEALRYTTVKPPTWATPQLQVLAEAADERAAVLAPRLMDILQSLSKYCKFRKPARGSELECPAGNEAIDFLPLSKNLTLFGCLNDGVVGANNSVVEGVGEILFSEKSEKEARQQEKKFLARREGAKTTPSSRKERPMQLQRLAVKIIPLAAVLKDKTCKARLLDEISISLSLDHPYVIKTRAALVAADAVLLVMEFANGGDLINFIRNRGGLDEPEARRIFLQLLSAMEYLHKQCGVSHRDIKPENVLLHDPHLGQMHCQNYISAGSPPKQFRFRALLADFGAATWMSPCEDKRLLQETLGTLSYAAPEILAGKLYDGCAVDIWSLGIVLFTMVYGRLPWDLHGLTLQESYKALLSSPLLLPCTGGPPKYKEVSPQCRALISKMLGLNPDWRPSLLEIRRHAWLNIAINEGKPPITHVVLPSASKDLTAENPDIPLFVPPALPVTCEPLSFSGSSAQVYPPSRCQIEITGALPNNNGKPTTKVSKTQPATPPIFTPRRSPASALDHQNCFSATRATPPSSQATVEDMPERPALPVLPGTPALSKRPALLERTVFPNSPITTGFPKSSRLPVLKPTGILEKPKHTDYPVQDQTPEHSDQMSPGTSPIVVSSNYTVQSSPGFKNFPRQPLFTNNLKANPLPHNNAYATNGRDDPKQYCAWQTAKQENCYFPTRNYRFSATSMEVQVSNGNRCATSIDSCAPEASLNKSSFPGNTASSGPFALNRQTVGPLYQYNGQRKELSDRSPFFAKYPYELHLDIAGIGPGPSSLVNRRVNTVTRAAAVQPTDFRRDSIENRAGPIFDKSANSALFPQLFQRVDSTTRSTRSAETSTRAGQGFPIEDNDKATFNVSALADSYDHAGNVDQYWYPHTEPLDSEEGGFGKPQRRRVLDKSAPEFSARSKGFTSKRRLYSFASDECSSAESSYNLRKRILDGAKFLKLAIGTRASIGDLVPRFLGGHSEEKHSSSQSSPLQYSVRDPRATLPAYRDFQVSGDGGHRGGTASTDSAAGRGNKHGNLPADARHAEFGYGKPSFLYHVSPRDTDTSLLFDVENCV